MKLTILVILAALFVLITGMENPALFFIGYLWTSVLYPNAFINFTIPFSFIFGIFSVGGYFFLEKSNRGRMPLLAYWAIVFGAWITFTTIFAKTPGAWDKWNWAIESVLLVVAAPIFLRTRAQIETAFIVTLSAISAHIMTAGIKTVAGTGGYDRLGRLMMTNYWLGETSTLGLVSVISLPMVYYAVRHSLILQKYRGRWLNISMGIYAVLAIMCMIGTSARTGLIAFGALLLLGIKGLLRKFAAVACAAALFFATQSLLPGKSIDRFNTIGSYQKDSSAAARIGVWNWAIEYTKEHPFGGGFGIFYTDEFDYVIQNEIGQSSKTHTTGIAPHSVYFEVLGEQGYLGEFLYLLLLIGGLWGTYRISRLRQPGGESEWKSYFGRTLFVCLLLFTVGASFIGIAFQPLLYMFLGFYGALYRMTDAHVLERPRSLAKPGLYAART